jgi:hypothetical protein
MTLFWSLALIPIDANLVITWSHNSQSRLRSDPGKPKISLIGVWHNENLPQGTNTIGLSKMTPRSKLIFDKLDSVRSRTKKCKNHSHTLKLKNSEVILLKAHTSRLTFLRFLRNWNHRQIEPTWQRNPHIYMTQEAIKTRKQAKQNCDDSLASSKRVYPKYVRN